MRQPQPPSVILPQFVRQPQSALGLGPRKTHAREEPKLVKTVPEEPKETIFMSDRIEKHFISETQENICLHKLSLALFLFYSTSHTPTQRNKG